VNRRRVALGVLIGALALANRARGDASPSRAGSSSGSQSAGSRSFNRFPSRAEEKFDLALRYADGTGLRKDPYLAAAWAGAAASLEVERARIWLRAQAEGGNAFAQLAYGISLRNGPVRLRDAKLADQCFAKALPALREAAARLDETALSATFALARAYGDGLGVPVDAKQRRALLQQAAARFYSPALNDFGVMMLRGIGGPKDVDMALKLIEGSAMLDYVQAQQNLGNLYRQGQLVPKSSQQAAHWFRLAALAGDQDSQFQLARMLELGEGIPQDYPGAVEMYRLAAAQGSAVSANNLGKLVQEGQGTPADPGAALDLFKQASEGGDAYGSYNLGLAYRDGLGVPMDLDQAQPWLNKAAKAGHDGAKRALTRLNGLRSCRHGSHLTTLFGAPIRCMTRGAFRQSIANTGGKATREDSSYWYDNYESTSLLEQSRELQVGYTSENDEFARAVYTFPSSSDREQVLRIAEMVAIKYGKPRRQSGHTEVGEVSFEWVLPDGVQLIVSRDWPDMNTYLEYIVPERFAQLKRELAAEETKKKIEQSRAQSAAF
jgi:TPR repeat protein